MAPVTFARFSNAFKSLLLQVTGISMGIWYLSKCSPPLRHVPYPIKKGTSEVWTKIIIHMNLLFSLYSMQGSQEEDILASSLTLKAIQPKGLCPYLPIRMCTLGGNNFFMKLPFVRLYIYALYSLVNLFFQCYNNLTHIFLVLICNITSCWSIFLTKR